MITTSQILGRVATLILACSALAFAQQPQAGARPRILQPGGAPPAEPKPLGSNYRIAFAAKSGDKVIGELSTLTCSSVIRVEGPLDTADTANVSATGSLEEKEAGVLYLEYQIGFSVPFTRPANGQPAGQPVQMPGVQYRNHMSSGCLMMKPGKTYEVLKVGSVSYSVTITAEPE